MVAVAIIGSAVVGGAASAIGSSKASKAQVQASEDATAAQERMFAEQNKLQEPFRQGGLTAQNRIMELLGLSAAPSAAGAAPDWNQYLTANPDVKQTYDAGVDKSQFPTPQSFAQWHYQTYGQNEGRAAPTAPAGGANAAPSDFGKYARDFGASDFEEDPGYAFRQSEGMKALERSAAARGNLLSGSTLKGVQRFGQDLASQEYQNAFNRYQVNRSNQLNPLQSLMGSGQSATNVLTGAAGQAGQNEASNIYNAGAARASGYVGQTNALTNALGQVGSYAANAPINNALIKYYTNATPGAGAGAGGSFGSSTGNYLPGVPRG